MKIKYNLKNKKIIIYFLYKDMILFYIFTIYEHQFFFCNHMR